MNIPVLDNVIFSSEKKYCEVCGVTLFLIRKEYKFREVKYVSEALCQELATKTRSILVYLTVGICGSTQTLSGYVKLTHLDFQVS